MKSDLGVTSKGEMCTSKVKVKVLSLRCVQLFVTPWTVCSPPGSSVHGNLQARMLEWVAIPFSRESSQPGNLGLPHCRQILYHLNHQLSHSSIQLLVRYSKATILKV